MEFINFPPGKLRYWHDSNIEKGSQMNLSVDSSPDIKKLTDNLVILQISHYYLLTQFKTLFTFSIVQCIR